MEKYLFESWHQFKVCFLAGCEKFVWGICRIITALFLGIFSLIRALWRFVVRCVARFPKSSVVICVISVVLVYGFTYTRLKAKLVAAEFSRDSLSYRLNRIESIYSHNTDSLILIKRNSNNDTIPINHD